MRYLLLIGVLALCLFSCEDTGDAQPRNENIEYLIFGQFYGFCIGEQCVEIFRLNDTGLYEDRKDTYPSRTDFYEGEFELLDADIMAVDDLRSSFPSQLLDESAIVFGCPDCADQGGYYLEIMFEDGTRRMWIFDTNKGAIPEYVHTYVDLIQQKINDIND